MNRARLAQSLGLATAACLAGADARAQDARCPLAVEPADAPAAWVAAARRAEARVGASAGHDCGAVLVRVDANGAAELSFATSDGRSARRALHAPDDLEPTLAALVVTLPSPAPTPAPPPSPPPTAPSPSTVAPAPAPPGLATPSRFVAGLDLGARLGLDQRELSPSFVVRGAYRVGPVALGLRGSVDPAHARLEGGAPAGFSSVALLAALTAEYPLDMGAFELPVGVFGGVAHVREAADGDADTPKPHVAATEPRLGLSARVVVPRDRFARFTAGLAFDVAPSGTRAAAAEQNGLPTLPRATLILSAGAELAP